MHVDAQFSCGSAGLRRMPRLLARRLAPGENRCYWHAHMLGMRATVTTR